MKFDSVQIARATDGIVLHHAGSGPILTDTRAIRPGSWFLAIVGERFDGHSFIKTAIEQGACGVIVDRPVEVPESVGVIVVDSTTRAIQALGAAARQRVAVPVIAITGSSGKTTTRELCANAISSIGHIHQTSGNLNNHFGLPMTLLAAPIDTDAVVVELGTSSPGEIELLSQIATPDVRVIINVGPAHLEELGTLEGVAREKGALFQTAVTGNTLVYNLDDPLVRTLEHPAGVNSISYGVDVGSDVQLEKAIVNASELATVATYLIRQKRHSVTIPSPGVHLAHNGAAAIAVALALGVPPNTAVAGLGGYQPVGMRLKIESLSGDVLAINDTYNANPSSMAASLALLGQIEGRRIAVLGDMLELGISSAEWHDEVVRGVIDEGIRELYLIGPLMSAAHDAAVGVESVHSFESWRGVAEVLNQTLRSGDIILFKGSRGAAVDKVLFQLKEMRCSTI